MCEFGTVKEPCFFCGQEETIRHSEHYTFCPDCTAIYTRMSIEKGCEHLGRGTVWVTRYPWYKRIRETARPHVKPDDRCNVCDSPILEGGW